MCDTNGHTTFLHVKNMPGYSGIQARTYPGVPETEELVVPTVRLDDDLPDGYEPHFIKIDVEGAELLVLDGARETLSRHRPVVVFEFGRGAADHYGVTPADVFQRFANAGMSVYEVDGREPLDLPSFQRAYELGQRWNYVARPRCAR